MCPTTIEHERARQVLCIAAPWIYLCLSAILARIVLNDPSAAFSQRIELQLLYGISVALVAHQISRCGTWIGQTVSLSHTTSSAEEMRVLDRISNLGIVATLVLFGPSLLVSFTAR